MSNICCHPIWLTARTGGNLTTLFHSFFLVEITHDREVSVVFRVPSTKFGLNDIESALKLFIKDLVDRMVTESFGCFVITSSMSSLYYLNWRNVGKRYFIMVSFTDISCL